MAQILKGKTNSAKCQRLHVFSRCSTYLDVTCLLPKLHVTRDMELELGICRELELRLKFKAGAAAI